MIAGPRRATVVRTDDPEGLGRITFRVEGLIDESEWALPFGVGMGSSQGVWNLPAVGALVWAMFEGGDIDSPVWAPGPWQKPAAAPEVPADAIEAQAEDRETAHLVRTLETEHFTLSIDERPSLTDDPMGRREHLRLTHRDSGSYIEIDGVNRGIYIKGLGSVVVEALGLVQLSAAHVQINERPVQFGDHVI